MIQLDGSSLTIEQLLRIADEREPVALAPEARERVHASRAVVERRALSDEPAYGINTGFGSFADVKIAADALEALQLNLLRSHAAGVGRPLPVRSVRATMALAAAAQLARAADIAAALPIDALLGSIHPFEARIHNARPFAGQRTSAANIEALMAGSGINKSHEHCGKVQDAYSMRCAAQVHGAAREALRFVRDTVTIEANSATDNPMVFADPGDIVSCGNFHGAPIAIAADLLPAAIVPPPTISGRR